MTSSLVMMAIIFGIFYFLLILPQRKEQKAQEELLASLQKGDRVGTSAGLHGRIWKVSDTTVMLEVADKVYVTIDKITVKRKIDNTPSESK